MSDIDLSVDICGIRLKNPVIAASGTFGFGREHADYADLNKIGGISVKGLTLRPREGNKPPRVAETPAGMLNSVGLQNPGVRYFIENEIRFLRQYSAAIIANIAGNTIEEYCEMSEILSDADIDAIELNVSCPNVKAGCVAFGNTPEGIYEITSQVRKHCRKPLIVKLTPNVTSISGIAAAAEAAGADAVSLINTLLGMAVDIETRRPVLANNTGGLSGPAVKPIAVRMVHEVYKTVKIPVIGMGGIFNGNDAVEFMLAGASAVMVGTANLVYPDACIKVCEGIEQYMRRHGFNSVADITGKLVLNA
ncbi:MAG TPA: dihydroorotate dehydrogenase [Clostridiales bacterium]|nr:dihydroorotate dehydrogenase [Clostridiales bacterium]HOL90719.1 dihydroorotate dehydrogenase [Clostridiales bacterium]HPP35388.1 dihydroorotate dehydrogenase [Clostridiales bacterium]